MKWLLIFTIILLLGCEKPLDRPPDIDLVYPGIQDLLDSIAAIDSTLIIIIDTTQTPHKE